MSSYVVRVNGPREAERITLFIRKMVKLSGARGVVLGLSGGIDSSVVGELCVRSLGAGSVTTLLLPSENTPEGDIADAKALAKRWGTHSLFVPIDAVVRSFSEALKLEGGRVALGNVQARVRMTFLYYVANSEGKLVAGTGDRSEESLGFFTKYGDGGVDFLPIAHLFKTQVRGLGAYLGLPRAVVEKPASPNLWPGHSAREELPADYDQIDVVLHSIVDLKSTPKRAAEAAGVTKEVVDAVRAMQKRSAHKRSLPPSLSP